MSERDVEEVLREFAWVEGADLFVERRENGRWLASFKERVGWRADIAAWRGAVLMSAEAATRNAALMTLLLQVLQA